MSTEIFELKNIIEAALLAANEPLTVDKMLSMFPADSQPSRQAIGEALNALQQEYEGRGIELKRIDRSYRFQTREKYAEWIARLQQERPPRYSRALLETLAIIAYKQPVTRGDIESVRGVSVSTDIIRTLVEREWVRQVGHRDAPGKPALYGTTRQFVEHFNLSSLGELPALAEARDLEQIGRELDRRLAGDVNAGSGEGNGTEAGLEHEQPVNVVRETREPSADSNTDEHTLLRTDQADDVQVAIPGARGHE
jgi:segregation and condensation protein B